MRTCTFTRSLSTLFDMIYLLSLSLILICLAGVIIDVDIIDLYRNYSLRSALVTNDRSRQDAKHYHLLRCSNLLNSMYYSNEYEDPQEGVIPLTKSSTDKIMHAIQSHQKESAELEKQLQDRHWFFFPLFHYQRHLNNNSNHNHDIVSSSGHHGKDLCRRLERILRQQMLDNAAEDNPAQNFYASIAITKISVAGDNNPSDVSSSTDNSTNYGFLRGATYQIRKAPLINAILLQLKGMNLEDKATRLLNDIKRWVIVDGTELEINNDDD